MRWVVLTDDHPPLGGGVATFTERVAIELVRRGHDARVYARARPGLPEGVIGVRGPSFARRGGAWLALRALPDLRRADRVLATTWPVATSLARLGLRPLVVAHGSDVTTPPLRPRAFHRVWRRARGFAVSAFLARQLAERGYRVEVLPAAVSVASAPVEPPRSGVWGMVARATPRKGGERFVRLVAAAGVRGVVVGDGPERARWAALAREIGADVAFAGQVPHRRVAEIVRGLDLVCLLPRVAPDGSGAEGLGLALVEAAAQGVPVVGSAVGGVPEAVGEGLVLADPDDADASARAILDWWTPARGREAWAACRARHGVERTVDLLASR